jgi:hypothetical protein
VAIVRRHDGDRAQATRIARAVVVGEQRRGGVKRALPPHEGARGASTADAR